MTDQGFRTLLLGALSAVALAGCNNRYGVERPFDATAWKNQDDAHPGRLSMVRDMLRKHPLKGLTRGQAVSLLGPPLSGDHKFADSDMVYWLAPDTDMGIDSEWLLIDVGPHGRVASARVVAD